MGLPAVVGSGRAGRGRTLVPPAHSSVNARPREPSSGPMEDQADDEPKEHERPELERHRSSGRATADRVDRPRPRVEGEGDERRHDREREVEQHRSGADLRDDQDMEYGLSDGFDAERATRLRGTQRHRCGQDRDEDQRRRPGLRPEESEQASRGAEDDRGQEQIADRPPSGPLFDPQLEVRDRPQEDGHERYEEEAEPTRDQLPEQRRRYAGDRGDRIAREAELGPRRTDDVDRRQSPERELGSDGDREPDGIGEPAEGGDERLGDRDPDRRRTIDAAEDGESAPIGEEAPDHATISSSASALRVARS